MAIILKNEIGKVKLFFKLFSTFCKINVDKQNMLVVKYGQYGTGESKDNSLWRGGLDSRPEEGRMGLPEDDREYYREQAGIERCIKAGTLIECRCGRISRPFFTYLDSEDQLHPLCERCRDQEEKSDREEE